MTPECKGSLRSIAGGDRLGAAVLAVAADLHARHGNADAGVPLHLAFELLEELALYFPHFSATQAGHVDVVARAVAFVVMAMAVDVQKIELVEQAVALQHLQGAIDGHAMHARIDLLGAFQEGVGGQVLFGLIHDVQQDAPLAREPHAAPRKSGTQFSRFRIDVQPLSRGDAAMIIFARAPSGNTGFRRAPSGAGVQRPPLTGSFARSICRSHTDQWLGKSRSTSLYITIRNTSSRNTIPTVTKRSLIFRLRSWRSRLSIPSIRM